MGQTTIQELKNCWETDKDFYKNKEIGELQDFVKEVLQVKELFNLKKGNLNTPNNKRKNEFTIETSKDNRRADFVIFINGEDIVIPVEVEKHGNIEAGIEQLFTYQKDWDKKYGILTDGNEWRFYKSSVYKSFYIQNILNNPKDFSLYWSEYIKSENYYIEYFTPSGQPNLFIDKLDLNKTENKKLFFDDVTKVISNFRLKIKAIRTGGAAAE